MALRVAAVSIECIFKQRCTLPMKPVAPVISTFFPSKYSGMVTMMFAVFTSTCRDGREAIAGLRGVREQKVTSGTRHQVVFVDATEGNFQQTVCALR